MAPELRQARRDRQLVSRRRLAGEDEDQADVAMDTGSLEQVGLDHGCYFYNYINVTLTVLMSFCQEVVSLFHKLLHSGTEKEGHLKAMSKVLRSPSAQLAFIKSGVHHYFQDVFDVFSTSLALVTVHISPPVSLQTGEQHAFPGGSPHWLECCMPPAGCSLSSGAVSLSSHKCGSSLRAFHSLSAHLPVGSEHQVHCEYPQETTCGIII